MKKAGAFYLGNGRCRFTVWAPEKKQMVLHLIYPEERKLQMQSDSEGFYTLEVETTYPGTRYFYMPDGEQDYPDPASFHQPDGVHESSAVIDHAAYTWQDGSWRGLPFQDLVLYELHVGTFTPEGTFAAIIPRLEELVETGLNAIELMPVAAFPGHRNWGYDGVYPYAVQNSYGGPEGLKLLVNACHARGIAVFLDVVYNHLGPEGNYLSQFGPYFTDQYNSPWGDAINFDGAWSDGVRAYISDNPLYWFEHYHLDGLRFDAIHAVIDNGAVHIWELIHRKVRKLEQRLGRRLYLTAESDYNSPRVVKNPEVGGYGFDAQWLDDFHHALYVLLDSKGQERYVDFGKMEQLAKAYNDGFVHSGEYVSFRKRRHGASSAGIAGDQFIVFNLNHDQAGNRAKGERLSVLINTDRLKLAAAALLLSPYVPLLFMGEEYAEESPFFYFVSHSDKELIHAVREGRRKEFASYKWEVQPPDPQAEETFENSKLSWEKRREGKNRLLLDWHRTLISLRRSHPVLQEFSKNCTRAHVMGSQGLLLHRQTEDGLQHLICLFNFSETSLPCPLPDWSPDWQLILDSTATEWQVRKKNRKEVIPGKAKANHSLQLPPLTVLVYEGRLEL